MKFLSYTYKQLNLLTLLLGAFLILLIYRNNITPTLQLYNDCTQMESQLEQANHAGTRLQLLKAEFRKLNRIAGNSKLSNEEIRQAILKNTNAYSENATITIFREPHVYSQDLEVITHSLDIQGRFSELISITNRFEKEFTDARLSALKLFSVEDNRTKKTSLYGTFYFQNFKKQ